MRLVKLNNNAIVMVMNDVEEIDGKEIIPNSEDAAFEKHVPNFKKLDDESVEISVNHVMEEDHYIEWIAICHDDKVCMTYLEPGKPAVAHCKYVPGSVIYAYCNKHQLWKKEVE